MIKGVDKNTVIYKYDTVNTAKVLLGCITSDMPLQDVTEDLPWHYKEDYGYDFLYLTLEEIYEGLKVIYEEEGRQFDNIITVLCESPLDGIIYQCNNYEEGEWFTKGVLYGYA